MPKSSILPRAAKTTTELANRTRPDCSTDDRNLIPLPDRCSPPSGRRLPTLHRFILDNRFDRE
jgi:hypothetical protein